MSHIFVKARFRGPRGEKVFERILVDTGATYTFLPPEVAEELGLPLEWPPRVEIEMADGRVVEGRVGVAEVEIEGRRGAVLVASFEGAPAVIGVQTLEALGLKANPVEGRLEPTRPTGRLLAYGGR